MSARMAKRPTEVTLATPGAKAQHFFLPPQAMIILMPYLEQFGVSSVEDNVSAMGFLKRTEAELGRAAINLISARFKAKLKQKELAEAADMYASHLSAMESGKRTIGKATAQRLAKVLGCPWRDLVSD
jgi:DNA-binding Xre family transcriptional regulator